MARYPVLERPLPPGLVTLQDYAHDIGYSAEAIRVHWRKLPGFPEPVGQVSRPAGLPAPVYEARRLETFRAAHANTWGRRELQRVVTDRDLDERVTLEEFAGQLAGTGVQDVARYREAGGFPRAGEDGRCRLGDLVAFWNTRPILLTGQDPEQRVNLGQAARILGMARKTLSQYRDSAGFPAAGLDGLRRLGDVVDFLNTGRPGKRGPSARDVA